MWNGKFNGNFKGGICMTASTVPHIDTQSLSPSSLVELYTLDARSVGGGLHRFSPDKEADGTAISFGNISYPFLNLKCEGFEWNGDGTLPRPKMTVSSINGTFYSLVLSCLAGAQKGIIFIRRDRTLAKFLDNHSDGGNGYKFPSDIYILARVLSMNKNVIQFELACPTDLPRSKIPARMMLRDMCACVYRHWDATGIQWIYDQTTMSCPYTGDLYFTKKGVATPDMAQDVCGRKLSDCVKRFASCSALPFMGFPGIARARASS